MIAGLAASAQAQSSINTIVDWNGSASVFDFGLPNTATYGQTITAPLTGSVLTDFSFELNVPATCTFKAYVYAWNGIEASGGALYTSQVLSTAGTGYEQVTINTGNLNLTPGGNYVLFLSASELLTSSGVGGWGTPNGDFYSGGQFVYLNNGTVPSQWTTTSWNQNYFGTGDLAFTADFTVTPAPEPSTLALAGLGGLGMIMFRKRK
jgi:hypothetical protein